MYKFCLYQGSPFFLFFLGGAVPLRVALCTSKISTNRSAIVCLLCTLFVYQVFGEHIQRYEIYIAYYIIPSREVKKKEDDAAAPAPHKGRGGECW